MKTPTITRELFEAFYKVKKMGLIKHDDMVQTTHNVSFWGEITTNKNEVEEMFRNYSSYVHLFKIGYPYTK